VLCARSSGRAWRLK
ncbi:hypothetical protein EC930056_5542, partial [Escherichia coli 93.0056]